MHDLFLFLLRISGFILILGLITPKYVLFWSPIKSRPRVAITYGSAALIFCLATIITIPSEETAETPMQISASQEIEPIESSMPEEEKQFIGLIEKYSVIYRDATTPAAKTKALHDRNAKIDALGPSIKKVVIGLVPLRKSAQLAVEMLLC